MTLKPCSATSSRRNGTHWPSRAEQGIDAVFVKTGVGNGGINVLYVYAPTAASPEATANATGWAASKNFSSGSSPSAA